MEAVDILTDTCSCTKLLLAFNRLTGFRQLLGPGGALSYLMGIRRSAVLHTEYIRK